MFQQLHNILHTKNVQMIPPLWYQVLNTPTVWNCWRLHSIVTLNYSTV